MEQIECSETSAYINQTPGNHPKENKQHSEHGESLKLRILIFPPTLLPLGLCCQGRSKHLPSRGHGPVTGLVCLQSRYRSSGNWGKKCGIQHFKYQLNGSQNHQMSPGKVSEKWDTKWKPWGHTHLKPRCLPQNSIQNGMVGDHQLLFMAALNLNSAC